MSVLPMVIALAAIGFTLFLPVAGISLNGFLLIGVGGVIGLLSGLLGVGGGFLLTPILMMIGVPATVAAASDSNAIVATSSSGVAAHLRLKNVDLRMGVVSLLGGVAGSAVGVECIKLLRRLGDAELVITLTYIIVLGTVGAIMLRDCLNKMRRGIMPAKTHQPSRSRPLLNRLPFQMSFPRSGVHHSFLVPFFLCLVVGLMTAVMGVGGGFMLVPVMVYLLGMPAHVAVGTSLFYILITCMDVTLMQANTNQTVDVVLALIIAVGSTVGAQVGARLSRRLRGDQLIFLLAVLALGVTLKMVVGVTQTPSNLLRKAGAHEVINIEPHSASVSASQETRR